MEKILNKIKEYNTIIIHGHQRPDGDCYGSQFGLQDIIKETYPEKKVYVVGEKCDYVAFLGEMDEISDDVYKNALVIAVDTATLERISDKRYNLGAFFIKIDHHIAVDNYGDYAYVDSNAPACAEIITKFYMTFKKELKLSIKGAKALYTGMVTDTGRFRFDSVTSKTFIAAAELLDNGVNIEEIDKKLSIETVRTLKLKGNILLNFECSNNGFVYYKMTRDIINKYEVTDEEAAANVSTLGNIEGCPVWALIIEYPNEIRIRLRSNGPDVDKLANKYQGGGHAKASGAKLNDWSQLEEFIADADFLVKNYKENN